MSEEILEKIAEDIDILRGFAYGNINVKYDPPRFDRRKKKRHRHQIVNWTAWFTLRRAEKRLYSLHRDLQEAAEKILEHKRPITSNESD